MIDRMFEAFVFRMIFWENTMKWWKYFRETILFLSIYEYINLSTLELVISLDRWKMYNRAMWLDSEVDKFEWLKVSEHSFISTSSYTGQAHLTARRDIGLLRRIF